MWRSFVQSSLFNARADVRVHAYGGGLGSGTTVITTLAAGVSRVGVSARTPVVAENYTSRISARPGANASALH